MLRNKRKGYMVERKVRMMMEKNGWKVVRAGGSLGEADLVCVKGGRCVFLQIKSSKKAKFYYYGYKKELLEGFPFYLIVDFGYGKIRVTTPVHKVDKSTGQSFEQFLTS